LVIDYSNLLLFNLGNPITVVSYILPGNGNEFWITFLITLHLTKRNVLQEVDMYLADESKHITSLNKFPLVKEVFIRFNSGLPSSAPVERLFSSGGQILTPRRSRLSDEHFEILLLLKANKAFK